MLHSRADENYFFLVNVQMSFKDSFDIETLIYVSVASVVPILVLISTITLFVVIRVKLHNEPKNKKSSSADIISREEIVRQKMSLRHYKNEPKEPEFVSYKVPECVQLHQNEAYVAVRSPAVPISQDAAYVAVASRITKNCATKGEGVEQSAVITERSLRGCVKVAMQPNDAYAVCGVVGNDEAVYETVV